jgi:hypothetical protein
MHHEAELQRSIPLTLDRVIEYLLRNGLLSERTLVEGDVRVEDIPGRNHNFRVTSALGPSYFLKQAPPDEWEDPRLGVEAELYRCTLQDESWSQLQPFLPRFCSYDAEQAVLATELEARVASVLEPSSEHGVLGLARVSGFMAHALATCHRVGSTLSACNVEFLPSYVPGILEVTRPHPSALQFLSPAQMQIIRVLQGQPDVTTALDKIRVGWTEACLIHGDIKWSNVLIRTDGGSGPPRGVMLTDWELAQLGDPAWDLGSVFHSYLTHAVLSAAVPDDASPRSAAEIVGAALSSFHGELGTFWDIYSGLAGDLHQDDGELLSRSVLCCIFRLIQSSYEWSQEESSITGHAAAILQLALNMLARPDDARRVVLGGLAEQSCSL